MTSRVVLIRLAFAIATLACGPGLASAQARIQSGEHSDFSRLAIVLPPQTEWRADPVEGGWRITFTPSPGPIDLTRVFDLIPRDRIVDVRQDAADGSLFVASTCDCHLDAFQASRGVVALDVKDGPDPAEATGQGLASGPAEWPDAPSRPEPLPPGLTIRSTATPGLTSPAIPAATPETGAPAPARPLPGTGPTLALDAEALDRAAAEARLEARLLEDMRRAADAGLVDLATQMPLPGPDPVAAEAAVDAADTAIAEEPGLKEVAARPGATPGPDRNISLRTSLDPIRPDDGTGIGLAACPPPGSFAFLEGRSASDLFAAMPETRAAIVDEAGAVDPAGARRLAEAWLALGFGAEAAAVARDAALPAPLTETYASIATILDTGRDEAPSVWSGLQRCPSAAALWAFLGHTPEPTAPPTDSGALQRAFFALPVHLRLQIGPDLVALLRLRGLTAAAAAVEGNLAVLRMPAAASTEAVGDDVPAAEAAGAADPPDIAPGQSLAQVDGLLEAARSRLAANRLPASDDLDLAEALVREHDGTERGDRLAGLVGLRRLAQGDLAAAAELLLRPDRPEDPGWRSALRSAAATTIVAMPDTDLLALALHPDGRALMDPLSEPQTVAIAERLIDLGFPGLALAALAPIDVARGSTAERTRARAILAAGDAAQALALIAGQDTPEVALLRGAALSKLGSHGLAAAAFAAGGDAERAGYEAWLSGDPEIIARHGTEAQRTLAASLLGPRDPSGPEVSESGTAPPIEAGSGPIPPPAEPGATDAAARGAQAAGALPSTGLSEQVQEGPGAGSPVPPDDQPPALSVARDLADSSTEMRRSLERLLAGAEGGT